MPDIGASEILIILVVAVLVIGPKDMPTALRAAGRWIGKMRKMSGHFRSGLDAMIREAEMEEMEKKWKAQNEKIMRENPNGGPKEAEQTGAYPPAKQVSAGDTGGKNGDSGTPLPEPASAEAKASAPQQAKSAAAKPAPASPPVDHGPPDPIKGN